MTACVSRDYRELEEALLDFIRDGNDDGFAEMAVRVFQFQRSHNPLYRKYCEQIGAPATLDDWRKIPAVTQDIFKKFSLRTFPEELTLKTFRTSGTTGEGFGSHHFCSLRLYDEAIRRGWNHARLPFLPALIFTQTPDAAPHSSLSYMMGVVAGSCPSARFLIDANGALDLTALAAEARKHQH